MTYTEQLQGGLHALVKAGEAGRRRADAMLEPMNQAVGHTRKRPLSSKPCHGSAR